MPVGHFARPEDGGPGVLVLHAWWGLNDTIRAVCDRLAREGFTSFAPDLYHGETASTIEAAEALSGALDGDAAEREVAAAADWLWTQVPVHGAGIGVVGFSLGAYFALQLAVTDPVHTRAVVAFYGTGPSGFERARASFLGHFAESDPYEPAELVDALESELRAAGRPVRFHRYPGTGHWFFEPDRPDAHDPDSAELAWDRTLDFLRSELGG
jgi:carboxymethylenebutenolidase